MKRIASLQVAVSLAFFHCLLELWRAFLDFTYVLPEFSGGSIAGMAGISLVYSLVFAGWLVGLYGARQGRRGGIITSLLFGALFWAGVDVSTLLFYCPGGCEHVVFDIGTWIAMVVGAAAIYGLAANLRRTSA